MTKVSQLAISEEGFVFNPMTGDSFQTSETGLRILRALQGGLDDDEVCQELFAEYDVSLNDAKRDVADFKVTLKTLGIL
jgi:hypothetical protein